MRTFLSYLLVIIISYPAFSQQVQAPPVAWGDIASGGYGGTFHGVKSGNQFYAVKISESAGSRSVDVNMYSSEGFIRSQRIFSDACTNCNLTANPAAQIIASTDGGVIVALQINPDEIRISKISENATLLWTQLYGNINLLSIQASNNGKSTLLARGIDGKYKLYRLSKEGSAFWMYDLKSTFPIDFKTNNTDGCMVTSNDSTKYIDITGKQAWSVKQDGKLIRTIDDATSYLLSNTQLKKINHTDGSLAWVYAQNNATDLAVTADKGCILLTTQSLVKITTNGLQTWEKTASGGQRMLLSNNEAISVINGDFITNYQANGTLYWQKGFTYNKASSLRIYEGIDNGLFVTTRGNSTQKTSLHGTGFLYRLLPVDRGCDYSPRITPDTKQTYCKQGSTTFTALHNNLDISYGFPTLDYSIEWLKDNVPLSATQTSFQTTEKGQYKLRTRQSGCSVESPATEITVTGNTVPIITNDLVEICKNGGATPNLTATNCNENVIWSNGLTGSTVAISPIVTTNYTATCKTSYKNNGIDETCTSNTSNSVSVKVIDVSDIQIRDIKGQGVICGKDSLTLEADVWNIFIPLEFSWLKDNNIISKNITTKTTEAGNYQLKVRDRRGCTNQTAVLNVRKSAINTTIEGKTTLCEGQSNLLKTKSSGGIGNYNYEWRIGDSYIGTVQEINATNAGKYKVIVKDDTGCSSSDSISVTSFPRISGVYKERTTIKGNLNYIFNKSTLLGGTPPFEILYNPVATSGISIPKNENTFGPFNSNSTIYLAVKDQNGCTLNDSIKIDYIPCNVAISLEGTPSFCVGGNTELIANVGKGVQPYDFQWRMNDAFKENSKTTNLKVNKAAKYQVVLTDSTKCEALSNIVEVLEKGADIRTSITASTDTTVYAPKTVTLNTVNETGYSYQWYKDNKALENATAFSLEATESGKYNVIVQKEGCQASSKNIVVTILIPLANEWFEPNSTKTFPNPVENTVQIVSDSPTPTTAFCSIRNSKGMVIFNTENTQKQQQHTWEVPTKNWSAGVYLVTIQTEVGTVTKKIVKQ